MPIVPCPDLPPELANHPKYRISRELGRGGMGVVYQGWHKEMNRQIVIKVINRALLDKPESVDRFRREIQAAAQLSHPNIVTAHDAERAGELHMLVMEFVPGQNLAEILEKKGPLSVAHACHYMRQAAYGLQHAYERGMVHRDIKPQNLIRTPNGRIKILDFGLAKMVRERETGKGLTPSDACMGTAEFMAPEQALDARAADIRADLYSLGCTLYCLLAGRPPFREDTWMKTILAHRDKVPQPLTELRPDVPERLWRVVARLMAKEPAQRYQKPSEVVAALAPFIKPGSKPGVKGASAPAAGVSSPVKGTRISADTNEIKNILREVPRKTPPKQEPAKEAAASPLADVAVNASLTLTRRPRRKGKKGCVVTAVVSASLALTLMLTAGIIIYLKTPEGTIVLEDLPAPGSAPDENGFAPLFNGKDKTGWKTHPNQLDNWRVVKGTNTNVLTWSGAFAGYLYSERGDYKDFRLLIEARINDEGIGGVYLRAPFGPQIPADNPTYPIGYEAVINSTRRDLNKTGSLYVSAERGYFSDREVPIPPDQWFWMEVIAEGNHITVKVNGKLTADYTDEKRQFTSGHIVVEQFGAGTKIEFRTIKIKELK